MVPAANRLTFSIEDRPERDPFRGGLIRIAL
jgi:hypothetical protein